MDKKKILIVCRAFYPENTPRAFRAAELAKEFSRQGYDVTVLLPGKSEIHCDFEKQHHVSIHDMGRTCWKSPDFGNSKVGYILTRAFYRFLSLAFEYPDLELMFKVAKALKKENNYDLLISIAVPYPIHWGVAKAWKQNQNTAKTWVADCGDPYMGCRTDSFRKWFYWAWVEKWFMRKADFVSIPVESARNAYYPEFQKKIKVIPQGFKINPLDRKLTQTTNQIPTFAYAGGFIPNIRDPRPFLDYLCSLEQDFLFVVFTSTPGLIENYQSKLKKKLQINNYIPREELLSVLSGMDFLVNFDNNTGAAVPSKLIDYAIAGKPVLNIEKSLNTKAIKHFMEGNYMDAMQTGDIDQYRIENVAAAFMALLVNI